MRDLVTYLNFDGTAREAMTFYAKVLGAELSLQTFAEAKMETPKGSEHRIVHARLSNKGKTILMASDTHPDMPYVPGTNFAVSCDCESSAEIDRHFAGMSAGGKVTMPVQDTFWNARFGMLTDKFGINWMFNFEKPKA